MRWQYKVSFFLLLSSQTIFFCLAAYFTENRVYYNEATGIYTSGYSWIWYHPEYWTWVLPLSVLGLLFFIYSLIIGLRKSNSNI